MTMRKNASEFTLLSSTLATEKNRFCPLQSPLCSLLLPTPQVGQQVMDGLCAISFSDEVSCHVSDPIHLTCSQLAFPPNVQNRPQGRQAVSLTPAGFPGDPWPSPGRTWWWGCRQLSAFIHPEQSHWRCLSCSQSCSRGNKCEEPGIGCFLLRAL